MSSCPKAVNPYQYSVVKSGTFNKASVSSAHPLASMVGAEIMKQGGNAFDATIATQFALAVVYPGAGNIGGGGFLLSRNKEGVLMGIDFREAGPGKAHRDMYLDEKGNPIEGMSRSGASASGVPGSVAGNTRDAGARHGLQLACARPLPNRLFAA